MTKMIFLIDKFFNNIKSGLFADNATINCRINFLPILNQRGFSLVEVLIATMLSSIIGGAALLIFIPSNNFWQMQNTSIEVNQELRKAQAWMKDDFLEGGSSTITGVPMDGVWYNTLSLQKSIGVTNGAITWSSAIQFSRGGVGGVQLLRTQGLQTKILAQSIQTLQFRRQPSQPNLVEINVTANKNTPRGIPVTQTLTFKAKMRN